MPFIISKGQAYIFINMAPYLIAFVVSLLFLNFALKLKNKFFSLFLHALVILPPVFLLTFRAESCGTDTVHYIDILESLSSDSLGALVATSRFEPLFLVIISVVGLLNMGVEFFFFLCALLTIVPVYIGVLKMKDRVSPIYSMALYYLMFYMYSFNIVRQSIAMSFVFLAVVLLIEQKRIPSIILGVMAMLFHTVAGAYFIILFIFVMADKKGKGLFLLLSIIVAYLAVPILIEKFSSYYDAYFDRANEAMMQKSYFVEMLLNVLAVLFVWKIDKYALRKKFLIISGVCYLFICISTVAAFAFRVANCMDILLIFYVPLAFNSAYRNRSMYKTMYLVFSVFYWWFVFIYNGSGEAYPYVLTPHFNLI